MLHFRKGTRSRPNVKVPKYFHSDYDDIIKPSSRDTSEVEDSPFPIEKIKTEPIDVVENDVTFESEAAVPFLDNPSPTMEEDDKEEEEDESFEEIDNFVKITLSTQHLIKDIDINVEDEGTDKLENGTVEEAVQSLRKSRGMEISTERPKKESEKPKSGLVIKAVQPSNAKDNVPDKLEEAAMETEEEERTMPVLSPKEFVSQTDQPGTSIDVRGASTDNSANVELK